MHRIIYRRDLSHFNISLPLLFYSYVMQELADSVMNSVLFCFWVIFNFIVFFCADAPLNISQFAFKLKSKLPGAADWPVLNNR